MTYKLRNTDLPLDDHSNQVCLAHHAVTIIGHGESGPPAVAAERLA